MLSPNPYPALAAMSLDDLERHAHASGDARTLAIIAAAEDGAGVKAEEVRERRTDKLLAARGVTDLLAERDQLAERLAQCHRQLSQARELEDSVRFVLRPFVPQGGKPKVAPKWAQHLRDTLRRIAGAQA